MLAATLETIGDMGKLLPETSITSFGGWLRKHRDARGLTLEALANLMDSAPAVISNLERGLRNPSRKMVGRLARALGSSENEGLLAAGFAPTEEIERLEIPEDRRETHLKLLNLSPDNQKLVDHLIDAIASGKTPDEIDHVG